MKLGLRSLGSFFFQIQQPPADTSQPPPALHSGFCISTNGDQELPSVQVNTKLASVPEDLSRMAPIHLVAAGDGFRENTNSFSALEWMLARLPPSSLQMAKATDCVTISEPKRYIAPS